MRRAPRALLAGAGTGLFALPALFAMPATAAPVVFSGTVRGNAGYAQNPFLQSGGGSDGSPSVGGGLDALLTSRQATSTTSLGAAYNREEYLRRFGHSDDLAVTLARTQQFSETLTGSARVVYSNQRNAFADLVDVVDQTSIGSRRKAIDATGSLNWTASARDSFGLSAFGTHASYAEAGLGDYDSYGATARYDRTISDRMTAGVSGTVSRTSSQGYGDTDTVQPNLTFTRKLSAFWTLDGSIGAIFQKSSFFGGSSKSTSLGFDAGLCGTYPRWSLCARASRNTSASGFGGLRTETSGSLSYSYTIDERSRFSLTGVAGDSTAEDRRFLAPRQRYASLDASYSRDLSRRISAGASAGYRYRKFDTAGSANGLTATLNLSAKIGRLQ